MTNTPVTTPETEAAFIALLQYYYDIEAMQLAWNHFKQHWSKYQADVALGTTHNGTALVKNLSEAEAWIGPADGTIRTAGDQASYFLYQYTTFKRIGVVTGINPKYIEEYRTTAEGWKTALGNWWRDQHEEMWNLDERKGKGIQFGTDRSKWQLDVDDKRPIVVPKFPNDKSLLRVVLPESDEKGRDEMEADGGTALYFFTPSMLNYIARKGAAGPAQNPYRNLYKALLELINELEELTFLDLKGMSGARHERGRGKRTYDDMKRYRRRVDKDPESANPYTLAANLVGGGANLAQIDDPPNPLKKGFYRKSTKGFKNNSPIKPGSQVPGIKNYGVAHYAGNVHVRPYVALSVAQGHGWDTDDNNFKGFSAWMKENISGNQGKGAAKLFAVDTAIMALIEHLADKVFMGTATSSTGFKGDDYRTDRRNKRLDMIKGFFGDSTAPTSGEVGERSVAEKVTSKTVQVKAKKQNLVPMDFQCFLLEQIRFLSNGHNSNYKHIMKLGTDRQPGLVKNKLNKTLSTDQVQALLELCPSTQALFTPYLKISRVDYDEYGKPTGVEKPLKIPNFLSGEALFDLASGLAPRVPGAGIKSFSWSLDGVQPAEVDNNISATLELYFQSVSDFFASSMQAGEDEASYLDLVISSPGTAKKKEKEEDPTKKGDAVKCGRRVADMLARKYEGSNYRIKVVAGWADPGVEALGRALGEDADRYTAYNISEAIENSKMSLFLQQTRHEFKFNQDGSLNLSIEYQASLTGMLVGPTADILGPSGAKIAEEIKAKEKVVDKMKKDEDKDDEKYKEELEELKKLRGQDKLQKYKKVLAKVYDSEHIYALAVNPQEFLLPRMGDLTAKERAERAKRKNSTTPKVVMGPSAKNTAQTELLDALADPNASEDEVADEMSSNMTMRYDKLEENPGHVTHVPFMFLGDLLDAVLSQMEANHEGSLNLLFFLSEVEMIDPLAALQIKNIGQIMKCGQDIRDAAFVQALTDSRESTFSAGAGITQLMNIGDIPISLDAFQVWYKDYVVKRDRDKYYFLHFVKDICASLITKALASKCFGPDVRMTQRFDAQPITVFNTKDFGPNKLVTMRRLNAERKRLKSTTPPEKVGMGLVLLSTDSKPKGLNGIYEEDVEQGVYHHYLGSQCGLVKTINFNRENQPYLRESKIQKAGSLGAEQLRELYSAELELYGNTLYKNGQYVYINPRLVGASKDELTILGLHGYYLITSVSSTVTENSFDVSVKALHEGIEFGDEVLMEPETFGDDLQAENTPYESPKGKKKKAEAPPRAAGTPPPPVTATTAEERAQQALQDDIAAGVTDPAVLEEHGFNIREAARLADYAAGIHEDPTDADRLNQELFRAHNADPYVQDHPDQTWHTPGGP